MAVLGKIRALGPIALISVIGLALFAFVLSTGTGSVFDVFKSDEFNISTVAKVNGIEMDRGEFVQKVSNYQANFQFRNNGQTISDYQAMKAVWELELRRLILQNESDNLDFQVENEMMRDYLKKQYQNAVEFQDENGKFDFQKMNQFISDLKELGDETTSFQGRPINFDFWNNFIEKEAGEFGLQDVYFKLINAGLNTTSVEGEELHHNSNDMVDFKYVHIPFSKIADSEINVTKSDLNNYIDDNKKSFSSDPNRDLIFVRFEEKATEQDVSDFKLKINKLLDEEAFENGSILPNDSYKFKSQFSNESISENIFNLKKNEIYGPYDDNGFVKATKLIDSKFIPETAKVRHILIPYLGSFQSGPDVLKSKDQARQTADSILNVLNKNRNKFNSLLSLSYDKESNKNDGIIEFAYIDPYATEFRDFSFENNAGSIEVVETVFGFHIIEILSQGKKEKAVKVADLALTIVPSKKTKDDLFEASKKFEQDVTSENFRDIAKERGYNIVPANNLYELDQNIPLIGQQRNIVKWAYDDETEVGSIKYFKLNNGDRIIAMLTSINETGMLSYDKASNVVMSKVRNLKKAEKIIESNDYNNLDEIAGQNDLEIKTALSVNISNPVISSIGNEPSVVGYAMGLVKETTSSAIIGNTGVFYIYVTDRRIASPLDNYEEVVSSIITNRSNSSSIRAYNALKDKADIEDFRSKIY